MKTTLIALLGSVLVLSCACVDVPLDMDFDHAPFISIIEPLDNELLPGNEAFPIVVKVLDMEQTADELQVEVRIINLMEQFDSETQLGGGNPDQGGIFYLQHPPVVRDGELLIEALVKDAAGNIESDVMIVEIDKNQAS